MFKNILAPLDGSTLAECTLPHLVALAAVYEARVTLVRVLECPESISGDQPVDPLTWKLCKAEAEAYLDDVARRLHEAASLETHQVLLEGAAAQRICEYTHEHEVDVIVISSHGRSGLSRWNVSGVVRKVVQRVHRSVMIVRAYKPTESDLTKLRYKRLLVPLDGSRRAECVLSAATDIARFHDAELLLGHVIVRPEMPHQMLVTAEDEALIERLVARNRDLSQQYIEQLRERLPYAFETRLKANDSIAAGLHDLVDDAGVDFVLLSAHGYSGKTKWPYGSITTSFIEYGTTPLLVIQDLAPDEVEPTEAETAAAEQKGH